ncbi:LCP family protein [Agromyces binzhouensis]|uniref:LCP family protein n=1 Tax=Agromyces binzhouensis TaxID=1817495 RepID=UPI0036280D53
MSDLVDAPHDDTPTDADGVSDQHAPLADVIPPPAPPRPRLPPVLTDAAVPPAHHGRLPRRSAGRAIVKAVGTTLAVLLVASWGIVSYAVTDLVAPVAAKPTVRFESERVLESVPDIGAMEGGLNFLLVGSDKRPADGSFGDPLLDSAILNDVTMLLHIAEDHSHVEVVSFPRDMLVDVPACQDPNDPSATLYEVYGVKLNTVLAYGGLSCVGRTIEQLVGVTIPVGGIIEFKGVAALAEAVGGVEVCLIDPIDDPYSGLRLNAGRHEITGATALAFLRTRHAVGDGSDLARISAQQTFLASLSRTLQADGTLGDPLKLYSIAQAVLKNMTLSSGLQDAWRLVSIARTLQDVDLSKIAFIQYPTVYTSDLSAVVPSASAGVIAEALQSDVAVAFDPAATGNASFGTAEGVEPSAEPTDAAAPPPENGTAAPTAPPPTGELLPSDVTGQTAQDVRCTTANPG